MLLHWYRARLRQLAMPLFAKWESRLGVKAVFVGIKNLMDKHLPQWRHYRKVLNDAPLGHADWTY